MCLSKNEHHLIGRYLLVVILMVLQCSKEVKPVIAKKGVVKTMHELPLNSDDYWSAPVSKLNDFTWNVLQEGNEKIIIDCPDFVPLNLKQKLPVVMVGARNIGVQYKKNFEGKTIGICTNLETGLSYISSVHRAPEVTSDIIPSPGLVVQDYVINLSQFLCIPPFVGTYKIWFVYFDLLSNGIICRLSADEESYNSKKEEEYLNGLTISSPRRTVHFDNSILFSKEPSTPEAEFGFEIKEKLHDNRNVIEIIINGNLPLLQNQIVNSQEQIGNLKGVCSIIPLDVLIIRTHGTWEHLSIGVPCYKNAKGENGKTTGIFVATVKLTELKFPPLVDGEKMFIYAFSGENATGPGVIE